MQINTGVLLSSFYTVKKQEIQENIIHTTLVFNEDHEIYDGHFPDNPITPGICLLQTTKQLLEDVHNESLEIDCILTMKFLKLVIPDNDKQLEFIMKQLPNSEDQKRTISLLIKDQEGGIYTKANIIYNIQ